MATSDTWEGKPCPVCGRAMHSEVAEEDKVFGIAFGVEWLGELLCQGDLGLRTVCQPCE